MTLNMPDYSGETASTIIGEHILFVRAEHDDDRANPLEDCEGMGRILSVENEGLEKCVAEAMEDIDAVPLERRNRTWRVDSDALETAIANRVIMRLLPETDADTLPEISLAGVWIPDKCCRESYDGQDDLSRAAWMVKQAECAAATYSEWCDGDCHGFIIKLFKLRSDEDGETLEDEEDYEDEKPVEEESCWGFLGWDYFESEMLSQAECTVKHLLAKAA